jgi:hypothetical protein
MSLALFTTLFLLVGLLFAVQSILFLHRRLKQLEMDHKILAMRVLQYEAETDRLIAYRTKWINDLQVAVAKNNEHIANLTLFTR